jgi:hypothetical protein
MKEISILLLAGATVVGLAAPIGAQSQVPSVKYDVTVTGHAETFTGSPGTDHFLSFSAPVSVPNVTLPAGTYLFTRVNQFYMRVMSPDRKTLYSTFPTVPAWRNDYYPRHEIVRFKTVTEGAPPRIVGVYPLWMTGFEPIYGKADKTASAAATASQ